MTIDLDEFKRLQEKVEAAKSRAERAKGQFDQLMERLKDEFDCSSIEEAEELIEQKKKERSKAEKSYRAALDKFEKDYGDKI